MVTEFDRGTPSPFGPYIKIVHFRLAPDEWLTSSPTIYGHAGALGAVAVGAASYTQTPEFGIVPAVLEPFSSAGPVIIFFDLSGAPLAAAEVRNKPDVVGPDGTNTTFFFPGTDPESDSFPNFFGTSAAAPHVAAVAALALEARPLAYPAAIYDALEMTASDMGGTGYDFDSGYGLVPGGRGRGAPSLQRYQYPR